MDKNFLRLLMEKTDFPQEARTFLSDAAEKIDPAVMAETVEKFYEAQFHMGIMEPGVEKMAQDAGLSPYTVWLLAMVEAAIPTLEAYKQRGCSEELFFNTFADLKYKVVECKNMYGVWGNFVSFWYPIFYSRQIVKLGRLEYETDLYREKAFTAKNGYTIQPGDTVRFIHIPSSGEPFHEAARLDSYRQAYEHFKPELHGGPLVCVCHSWLLYPPYGEFLPEGSNFKSFQKDFEIPRAFPSKEFDDGWRLFGPDCEKPLAELPERTSMQRAFKKYFLEGGQPGTGVGILLFDGEKIVNR